MREGSMDIILDKMMKQREKLIDTLSAQFKGTKPFATEKLSPDAQIWAIDNMGTEDMEELIGEFGQEAIGYMLYQVNKMRTDKRGTRWQTEQI